MLTGLGAAATVPVLRLVVTAVLDRPGPAGGCRLFVVWFESPHEQRCSARRHGAEAIEGATEDFVVIMASAIGRCRDRHLVAAPLTSRLWLPAVLPRTTESTER